MSILDKIARGVKKGIKQSINKSIEQKVESKVSGTINSVFNKTNSAPQQNYSTQAPLSGAKASNNLNNALGGINSYLGSFASNVAKDMKVCPSCGEMAKADTKFCPSCGGQMPEQTLAQGALCPNCGKQNELTMRFCSECGTKLPSAVAEEQANENHRQNTLQQWATLMPQYPVWNFGGEMTIEQDCDGSGNPYFRLSVENADYQQLESYRELLITNGFKPEGEYPSRDMLYKRIDGVSYCFESCEPFPADEGQLMVSFSNMQPTGGYDYVKPQPKKKSFFDLFK